MRTIRLNADDRGRGRVARWEGGGEVDRRQARGRQDQTGGCDGGVRVQGYVGVRVFGEFVEVM
jgi:hypothetical protein